MIRATTESKNLAASLQFIRTSTRGLLVSPKVKHSLRRLFKSPAFALTAIITVGAAIGANALIFSVVNGVILKPLPYANPETLVGAWLIAPGVMQGPLQQSAGTYFMIRERRPVVRGHRPLAERLGDDHRTRRARAGRDAVRHRRHAAAARHQAGARADLHQGRRSAERPERRPHFASLLAARLRRRARRRSARRLMFNGAAREVVGVLPEDFRFLRANPLVIRAAEDRSRHDSRGGLQLPGHRAAQAGRHDRAGQRRRGAAAAVADRALPAAAGLHARRCSTMRGSDRWCVRSTSTSSATSATCCGSCSAPSDWCCSSRARTSRTCSSCAPRRVSRSWRSGSRSAPKRAASRGS